MLLPEASLDMLVEQLKALPRGDRQAVLALLSPDERRRVRARLSGNGGESSPYSPAIAARLASLDSLACTIAPGTRRALATMGVKGDRATEGGRGVSLLDAIGGLFRRSVR